VQLRGAWAAELGEKDAVELEAVGWLSRCTLDIIGLAGFGYAFDALSAGARANELQAAVNTIFNAGTPNAALAFLATLVPAVRHLVRASRYVLAQTLRENSRRSATARRSTRSR
jgi:hypothetical protein